jgi:hypothetical protein
VLILVFVHVRVCDSEHLLQNFRRPQMRVQARMARYFRTYEHAHLHVRKRTRTHARTHIRIIFDLYTNLTLRVWASSLSTCTFIRVLVRAHAKEKVPGVVDKNILIS